MNMMARQDDAASWLSSKFTKKGLTRFFFDFDRSEREAGDDTAIFFFAFTWFFAGITLIFFSNPDLAFLMQFYLYFDLCCLLFCVLYFWRTRYRTSSSTKLLKFTLINFIMVGGFICMFLFFWQFGSMFLQSVIPGSFDPMRDATLAAFEFFRLIPAEELVFRGLGIELFLILEAKTGLEHEDKPDTIKGCLKKNAFFIIGAVITSFLFGFLHFRTYPEQITPLIYLTVLGLMASWLRFKFGLFASIMLHGANNLIVQLLGVLVLAGIPV